MIQGKFEAKIDRMHKTQPTKEHEEGLWKVQFSVHPDEFPVEFATKSFGTRYMIAFAEIGDDEQPVVKQDKSRTPFHELPRSQQAGILCQDEHFQVWLRRDIITIPPERRAECVARTLREYCEVTSRADFDKHIEAAMRWDNCLADFEQDTGRRAQRHG